MKKIFLILAGVAMLASCKTTKVDLESIYMETAESTDEDDLGDSVIEEEFFAEVMMKENDISQAVIMLESPEVLAVTKPEKDESEVKQGVAAVKANFSDRIVYPEYEDGKLRGWLYREGDVYRVITQTYHSTLIRLEPGEDLIETPFISEPDAWRISRGVAVKDGVNQHVIAIKPDYSGLNSSLIIVTDRRIYQLEITSTKETYMPTVQWVYPRRVSDRESYASYMAGKTLKTEAAGVSASLLSFDYVMTHPANRKPAWCPTMAYDDGVRTYIVLSPDSLLKEFPVIFNEAKEIINFRTNDNVIILDRLIEKVTLRNGSEKVTIQKKVKSEK